MTVTAAARIASMIVGLRIAKVEMISGQECQRSLVYLLSEYRSSHMKLIPFIKEIIFFAHTNEDYTAFEWDIRYWCTVK
jgi:hypothetical protein